MIDPAEYAPFYERYIARVGDADLLSFLRDQQVSFVRYIDGIPEEKGAWRYADGKWTVKQLLQHVIDAERVFAYRMLRISRGDETPLAGFDENDFAAEADAAERTLRELADEFEVVRASTIALYESLPEPHTRRWGTASDAPVTVRALAYMIGGHCAHHLTVLRERYGIT